jgi:hypothetical protein
LKKENFLLGLRREISLNIDGDSIELDAGETRKRKKKIGKLMDDLWK